MEGGPEGGVCGCVSSMAISLLSRAGFTKIIQKENRSCKKGAQKLVFMLWVRFGLEALKVNNI